MTGEKPSRRFLHLWQAFCTIVLVTLAGQGEAQAVKLTGDEIRDLLTGNTAVGRWDGIAYRQYFGSDGVTFFAQEGARTARGEWRVDDAVEEYQSIWPGDTEWEGWFVMEWDGTHYWVSRATPPTPFELIEGEALVADAGFSEPTCSDLDRLAAQAADNFLQPGGDGITFAATQALSGAQDCRLSRGLSGANAYRCAWEFDYRDDAASAALETLTTQLVSCGAEVSDVPTEDDVNHPDTYIQRLFALDGITFSAALKDKAGPQQTIISLTAQGVPAE